MSKLTSRARFKKNLCLAPVLTEFINGRRQCKRKPLYNSKYCYQHGFLENYTGYYIDRNFIKGKSS